MGPHHERERERNKKERTGISNMIEDRTQIKPQDIGLNYMIVWEGTDDEPKIIFRSHLKVFVEDGATWDGELPWLDDVDITDNYMKAFNKHYKG